MRNRTMLCLAALITTGAAQAAEIKVGAAGAFTGPVAEIAANIQKARELAVQGVNAAGGVLKGDTIRLVPGDGACDAKTAVDSVGKLVNVEQVVSMIGPTCSGPVIASAQTVTIPAGVMVIADAATSPAITTLKDNDTVFRTVASDADQGGALAKLVTSTGNKSIAIIVTNDDYNTGIASIFEKAYAAAGGKVTGIARVEAKQVSYRAELASLAKGGAHAILICAYYGSGGITMIKNSLEAGLFDKFYGSGGMANQAVVTQIGAENLKDSLFIVTPAADVDGASYKAFATIAKAGGLDPAVPYAANGYDAAFLTALAIEKAGAADRAKLPAALREVAGPGGEIVRPGEWAKAKQLIAEGKKINYEGASGPVDFDAAGDVSGTFGVSTVGADGNLDKTILK